MWSIAKEDSLSSFTVLERATLLERAVFSLFMPLKLRSAAQADKGQVGKVTRATYIPG